MAVFLALACSHARRPPQPSLPEVLVLEPQFENTTVTVGKEIPIVFELRNTAATPVKFCQLDGGVSMWVRGETGPRPIKLYSLVLDAVCNERTRLAAGQVKRFEDTFALWPDLSGEVDLFASIRVSVPRNVRGIRSNDSVVRAKSIRLTVRPPSNSGLAASGSAVAEPHQRYPTRREE